MKAVRPLSRTAARRLLASVRGRRVLVVGDVMLDEFLWGRVARISPEAPVPVVEIASQSFHLGGAANVAANVASLGGTAVVVGVVGRDAAGQRVRESLSAAAIEEALVVAGAGRPTTLKTRIIAHNQQVVRADREDTRDVPAEVQAAVVEALHRVIGGCGAVIVSDYQKGLITRALMKSLVALARRRGIPVLVDPKVRHFALYRGASLVTPNQGEAEQATGLRVRGEADLRAVGARILRTLRCPAALVTRGEHGMSLFRQAQEPLHIPTAAREVFDVTGAGDTVIATLGLALAAGADLPRAALLANQAAGVVVAKVGTATADPDEVLASIPGA